MIIVVLLLAVACCILAGAFLYFFINREHNPLLIKLGYDIYRGDYWAVSGWTKSLLSLRTKVDVVMFGDSLTYNGPFSELIKDVNLCNLGYAGDELISIPFRVPQVRALNPDKVFLMIGVNSIGKMDICEFEKMYDKLIGLLKDQVPSAKLYLLSMLPVGVNNPNRGVTNKKIIKGNLVIKNLSDKYMLDYIDIHDSYVRDGVLNPNYTDDGLHLRQDSYGLWVKKIETFM